MLRMAASRRRFREVKWQVVTVCGPCTSPQRAFALKAGCQFYGRCRRKYWTIAPIPNTIAGNRIATTIGGRAASYGVISRGAIIKKAAARPVIATHCLAILEKL